MGPFLSRAIAQKVLFETFIQHLGKVRLSLVWPRNPLVAKYRFLELVYTNSLSVPALAMRCMFLLCMAVEPRFNDLRYNDIPGTTINNRLSIKS